MYCYKCGLENEDTARFCYGCGTELHNKQNFEAVRKDKSDTKKKSNKRNYIVPGMGIILVVSGFIYLYLGSRGLVGGLKGRYYYYSPEGYRDDYTSIIFMSEGLAYYIEHNPYDATYREEGNKVWVTVTDTGQIYEFDYIRGKLLVDGGSGGEFRKTGFATNSGEEALSYSYK